MKLQSIGKHCCFLFSPEIELLHGATGILQGEPVHGLCTQMYGEKFIGELKRKYSFLFEVFEAHARQAPFGFLEPLLLCPLEDFSLKEYRRFLLKLPREELITQYFFGADITEAEVALALADDAKLEALYWGESHISDSLLGLRSLLHHTDRFIEEYISLAEALRTPAFEELLAGYGQAISDARTQAQEALATTPPLDYSQSLMGKTFHHRGPYESFVFSVSLLMPCRAVRVMGKRQILFHTLRRPEDMDIVPKLKAIADPSRFQIITLMGERGPLRGTEIAKELGLAPSTVSHHIEQLKKAGVILEEPVKNSRYYSLNRGAAHAILARLSMAFGGEKPE